MPETFVIADTHFGHKNIIDFVSDEGRPVRPFDTLEEMHEVMIERWNAVVRPQDLVYHLGDVAFTSAGLDVVGKLNGRKRLVRGNHDMLSEATYRKHFQRVYGVRSVKGAIMSHVPLHPSSLDRWGLNIHGHLHDQSINDPRYVCVSVEQTNYAPVPLDLIRTWHGPRSAGRTE